MRLVALSAFLREKIITLPECKILVFVSNCDSVDYYHAILSSIELPVEPPGPHGELCKEKSPMLNSPLFKLHGSMDHESRSKTFKRFKELPSAIMFCTDVAARGIDYPKIDWIVQYDVPSDPKAYIHRIGRTARIGNTGDALLFLIPSETPYINLLTSKGMTFTGIEFEDIISTLETNLEKTKRKDPEVEAGVLLGLIMDIVEMSQDTDFKSMAIKSYLSFVRSYATHNKSTKNIFHIKNLHLGHLSKSFALTETPTTYSKVLKKNKYEAKFRRQDDKVLKTKWSGIAEFAA